ncbi:MAG: sulfotransferase family protein [Actinocatenispora sp.]
MGLRVVGAGLPRTGTSTLQQILERLLADRCYHMRVIPNHPFDLGSGWRGALLGGPVDWNRVFEGYAAAVDWPTSAFWREISAANPDALVLLSVRDDARTWWESMDATVLAAARASLAEDWTAGRDLTDLLKRFAGRREWDDPDVLMRAYDEHVERVRRSVPAERLLEWRAADGWGPICDRLGMPVPDEPVPWRNRREDWG